MGQIELIIGFGKSMELIRRAEKYRKGQFAVLYVAYDNAYAGRTPTMRAKRLTDIDTTYYQVIAIDEGHLFPDLVEKCEEWANTGIFVIVAALDATFEREPFQNVINLIPKAEHVTKLSAICVVCSGCAAFSLEDMATCRACYFKMKRLRDARNGSTMS